MTSAHSVSEALRRALPDPDQVPPASGPRAAVAAIVREGEAGGELLFIRRSHHPLDPWSGHIAFPGGRVDPGDASGLAAAMRETREEVGLDLAAEGELLGRLGDLPVLSRGRLLPLTIEAYAFRLHRPEVSLRLNYEVEATLWLPARELADPARRGTFVLEWDGTSFTLPFFDVDGHRLWGLTLRMVDDLLHRAGLAGPPPPLPR